MLIFLGFTFIIEKQMLIVVTDIGKFICIHINVIKSEIIYSLEALETNFSKQVENFTCTSAVFSKNQCTCVLAFE